MEAGRELDALVAEKVMGLEVRSITVMDSKGTHSDVGTVDAPRRMPDGRMGVNVDKLPAYSTDIAAAWEVVEKLGLAFELGWLPEDKGFNWDASFGEKRGSEAGTTTYASTAPHAICLAALKAMSPGD